VVGETEGEVMKFKVHVGYTATGRNRWRRFETLALASAFCEAVHRETGVFLSIEAL
jgi:hypothetical protein